MVIPKEILSDYKELYEKANRLVEEESRNDPPTDPFRSHYKARDVLADLKKQLDDQLVSVQASEEDGGQDDLCYRSLLAFVCRDLGRIYVYTEEPATGEELLNRCLELVTPHKQRPEGIIPYIGAINELSIVLGAKEEYKKGLDMLLQAEKSYEEFKVSDLKSLAIQDIFSPVEEGQETAPAGAKELESLYTLVCFYLAQMYGHLGRLRSLPSAAIAPCTASWSTSRMIPSISPSTPPPCRSSTLEKNASWRPAITWPPPRSSWPSTRLTCWSRRA